MTIRDLITDALTEIGVVGQGQALTADDAALGLRRLNRLLDTWNARRQAVYANVISTHTLTPALQPHTIGASGGTFTVTVRPVSIDAANLVVSGLHTPLTLRDAAWWMDLPDPTTSGSPTDLYYEPAWPLGQIRLWPVPDAADTLELSTRVLLTVVTLDTTFSFPPGYESAVLLSLAEDLARPFGRPLDPQLTADARQARGIIFANNDETPTICTTDAGMPSSGSQGTWDYQIGRSR